MGISYNISNVELPNVCVVIDLGITIDSRLDYSDNINTIVTTAHQRACLILCCFKSKEHSLLFPAFSTIRSCGPINKIKNKIKFVCDTKQNINECDIIIRQMC